MTKTNKKILAGAAVSVLVLAAGLFTVAKADSTFLDKVAQYAGTFLGKDLSSKINLSEQSFGALAGPDIPYPYIRFGNVMFWAQAQNMATATTTICALQGPSATSTLFFASANIKTSSTTASLVTIAKASTAFATTTIIGSQYNLAANDSALITASSTSVLAEGTADFTGDQWLVVGMQGGTGTMSPTGTCQALWIVDDTAF
jgi:hypothetical protein